MMSIMPTQKLGRLKPRMDPPMMTLPLTESGLRPAHMPSGMPTKTVINRAKIASSKVAGMRSTMTLIADTPWIKEFPRLPVTAFFRKTTYCSCIGRSSPSARTAFCKQTRSQSGETRSSVGLPTILTPKKTMSDMAKTTMTLCNRRRVMNTVKPLPPVLYQLVKSPTH